MQELINTREKHLLTLWIFKYYPAVGSFTMWLYVGLLIFNNHLIMAHNVTSNSFIGMLCVLFLMINFVMMLISDVLGFCRIHRLMFAYMGIVGSCISYEYFIGFGSILLVSRIVVFLIGLILFIYALKHRLSLHK